MGCSGEQAWMVSLNVFSALMKWPRTPRDASHIGQKLQQKQSSPGSLDNGLPTEVCVLEVLSVSSHMASGADSLPEFLASPCSVCSVPDSSLYFDLWYFNHWLQSPAAQCVLQTPFRPTFLLEPYPPSPSFGLKCFQVSLHGAASLAGPPSSGWSVFLFLFSLQLGFNVLVLQAVSDWSVCS